MRELREMFAVRFYERVAEVICREIERANDGVWPGDQDERGWVAAAGRFRIEVSNVPLESFQGCYDPKDNTIYLPKFADAEKRCRMIAHELMEALIYWGSADGHDLLDWPQSREDGHICATLAEALLWG